MNHDQQMKNALFYELMIITFQELRDIILEIRKVEHPPEQIKPTLDDHINHHICLASLIYLVKSL